VLNFSRLKISLVFFAVLFFFYIFLGNFFTSDKYKFFLDKKVNLGLDLQGGSYLLLEVDINPLIAKKIDDKASELKKQFKDSNISYKNFNINSNKIIFEIQESKMKEGAVNIINESSGKKSFFQKIGKTKVENFNRDITYRVDKDIFTIQFTEEFYKHLKQDAINQSLEIVRKRIDQLGTKEPNILQKGENRILVELPGLTNPSHFKNILGKTAQLTFKFVKSQNSSYAENSVYDKYKYKSAGSVLEVEKKIILTGDNLKDAQPGFDRQTNESVVSFKLDGVGAAKFAAATKENVGRPLAIILDNEILSAPVIREPILTGSGQISGNFTVEEANQLSILLRSGALPAPMKIVEERTVGSDLGEDSVKYGVISFISGFLLVALYIIYEYRIFGVFADICLLLNVVILAAVLTLFGSTLTLPGIAGIVLTTGMSVDTNVIIYERLREEYKIEKSMIIATDAAYRRSLLTIIDTHLTTLIAGIILFYLGSGPVRGFALTLIIGLVSSFFTAFTVSRLMVGKYVLANKDSELKI
jgi:protein-export membrane protein SecD